MTYSIISTSFNKVCSYFTFYTDYAHCGGRRGRGGGLKSNVMPYRESGYALKTRDKEVEALRRSKKIFNSPKMSMTAGGIEQIEKATNVVKSVTVRRRSCRYRRASRSLIVAFISFNKEIFFYLYVKSLLSRVAYTDSKFEWVFRMYILKKRDVSDVLFLLCQMPGFMCNNKSSIQIEDLKDRKLL